ncbi:hypothetical protein JAAARDRAFT_166801 [Jaapia argillacea MUCL 33604]|uniref:Dolichyl-diphosphooligosaccharide--protein glycosyltransferase subunit 1 n=1 Tax=Jaapia argillacea MUCL 33604 TaxID=933084 RepID=A0A067QEB4_9AGAM|nr:hypothetical protein JAAARDRAFT_166801 [Jaapia argillacea MUCL 33604]
MKLWPPLAVLCSLLAVDLVWAAHSFENTAIVRTVELGGSLVHVTTTYAIKSLEAGSSRYTIALGRDEHQKTSWLEVRLKGQQAALPFERHGTHLDNEVYLYDVTLPKALATNGTANIVVETVQTHATYPWPQEAAQSEDQALKYESDLFVLSPYETSVQRTKLRSSTPSILSFTQPEEVSFATENPATKSGTTVTYGPYYNIPASASSDFIAAHQQHVTVQYNHGFPVLEVTKLKRAAEVSHWGANLNIQDEIILHNAGPRLKGHFSRLQHQTQSYYNRPAPHVLSWATLLLPAGISNVYYYDLIGNVSTSRLRTAPSPPKGLSQAALNNHFSTLEIRPRYPLMGGWNYSFTLGWDAPLGDSAVWDAKTGKYILGVPVMTLIPGAVVDEAEVKIVLPEGASDIEFFAPFPALSNTLSTHISYLDTTGRPAVTFEYKDLTDKHTGTIYITYKVPFLAHLKKPIAVGMAFFALFSLAMGWRRVDTRIHTKQKL